MDLIDSPLCSAFQSVDQSSMHISSGCKRIAKQRYMIRRNLIATCVHWKFCRKFEMKVTRNCYKHFPLPHTVSHTGNVILCDVEIKTNTHTKKSINRPDIIKMPGERKWQLIDIPIPQDHNIVSKETNI